MKQKASSAAYGIVAGILRSKYPFYRNTMQLLTDYLIVLYLFLIGSWPVTLSVLLIVDIILLYRRNYMLSGIVTFFLVWMALAAWQFEHYLH